MVIKDKFARIQRKYAGRILIKNYGAGMDKSLTFSPLTTGVASGLRCECGAVEFNATNFSNLIHFCPNKEYQFEVTDFHAIPV